MIKRHIQFIMRLMLIALKFLSISAAITLGLVVVITLVVYQDITQIREVFLYAELFYVVMVLMVLSEVIEKKM